jgi:2-iminobutanoate/2-iminopropanoate deaminase
MTTTKPDATSTKGKEVIEIPVVSDVIRKVGVPLSPVVRANGFLFLSGTPGIDLETGQLLNGDIESQTEGSLKCVKHILEHAGSSMDKVVKVTIYASNSAHFKRINQVYSRYFSIDNAPPARTFVTVASWPLDFDIEIEVTALE